MQIYPNRAGRILRSAAIVLAGFLFAATSALAGVGLSITPGGTNATVKAGQMNLTGSLQIKWLNTTPNETHANDVTSITVTPSCGTFVASADCPAGFLDPGVFTLAASGTGTGCGAVTTFTISVVDAPSGKVAFTPGFQLPVGGTCTISFNFNVNTNPTKDADPTLSGLQTAVLGAATAVDAVNGNPGSGLGTAEISFPVITTTPGAGGTLGAAPVNLSDSATITGLVPNANNNPPTGTVTFSLFVPSDATCAGTPFQSQTVDLATNCTITPLSFLTTCATSNTFTANTAGVWHWTAVYSGNADNQSVNSPCAAEPVTVSPASPAIQTSQNPASGTLLFTPLGDVADLSLGFNPTGTITFTLFAPSDPNCAGAGIFTNVVNVTGNGIYATSASAAASLITSVGTYQWRASYSGDVNNNPITSPCGAEPVIITQPVLSVAKTPDGATISAGSTATFTIVVSNAGPGTAANVSISDTLPSGNGVNWQTASAGCTITGAVGSQVLNCSTATLAQGATFTAVATAATTAQACAVMNNTVTVTALNAASVNDVGSITCLPPGLQIVKTPDGATIVAGQTATFTIVATNVGPGTATAVTLSDPLPAGGGVNWSTTSPGCTVTGAVGSQVLNCTFGDAIAGGTATIVVTAATTLQTCTALAAVAPPNNKMNNTATLSATNAPSVSDVGDIACVVPGLSIVKSPDGGTVVAGQTATFTIVATNNGPGTATGMTLSDSLPAGGGVNWTTSTPGCTVTGAVGAQTLNCTFGDVALGGSQTIVVAAATSLATCQALAAVAAPNNKMNNTATVSATNAVSVSDVGDIACILPGLSIVKSPDGGTVVAGQTATFTIVATNNGPGTANGVTLSDPLPAGGGVNWTTSTPGCTVTGAVGSQVLNCTFGDAIAGGSVTIVVAAATSLATCQTLAAVAAPNNKMNNTATLSATNAASVSDVGDITCLIPVLAIAKTPDGGQVAAGSNATFTVVVTNNGPGTATNLTISDPLPAGGGVTWSTATAGCTVTGAVGSQTLSCTVASLAQGGSTTVVVTAPITVQNCAAMNNTATASASNAVAVSDTGSITCAPPTLQISKTPDGGSITPGATAQFNIVITNNGPGVATGVVLTDLLPAGGGVNWQTSSAGCSITGAVGSQSLNCSFGDLGVGGSATAIVTAVTSPATCTTMNNTATATATNASPITDTGSISCIAPPPATIPTLSEMGMLLLASLLMAAGFVTFRRRRM